MAISAGYHPLVYGQAERNNQTVKISLRTMLLEQYEGAGESFVPELEIGLNSLTSEARECFLRSSLRSKLQLFMDSTPLKQVQEFTERRARGR